MLGISNARIPTPLHVKQGLEMIKWMPCTNGGPGCYITFAEYDHRLGLAYGGFKPANNAYLNPVREMEAAVSKGISRTCVTRYAAMALSARENVACRSLTFSMTAGSRRRARGAKFSNSNVPPTQWGAPERRAGWHDAAVPEAAGYLGSPGERRHIVHGSRQQQHWNVEFHRSELLRRNDRRRPLPTSADLLVDAVPAEKGAFAGIRDFAGGDPIRVLGAHHGQVQPFRDAGRACCQ